VQISRLELSRSGCFRILSSTSTRVQPSVQFSLRGNFTIRTKELGERLTTRHNNSKEDRDGHDAAVCEIYEKRSV